MKSGDLFLALPGERVDGHDFVSAVLDRGAGAALVQKDCGEDVVGQANKAHAAIIRVEDTRQALVDIAAAWRKRLGAKIIALTGSSGKTTTKTLMNHVLSAYGRTVSTLGNQNNELGVPATLLRIQEDTEYAVVEMGMRGLHQLDELCSFVRPDAALVTNVGTSHMELLGSRENIARAKAEPFASLSEGGLAFINASDEYARELRSFGNTERVGIEEVFFDGSGANPDIFERDMRPIVYASDIELDEMGCPHFVLNVPNQSQECTLSLGGLHNVHNAVAAAAVAWKYGMGLPEIVEALRTASAPSGRQRIISTACGYRVVDDAYNANPDSMRASLSMFGAMRVQGKRIAVLGDMGELGSFSQEGHAFVGRCAAGADLDMLYCIGELSQGIAQAAIETGMPKDRVVCGLDALEVLACLKRDLKQGDAVLVKASHAMALERIVEGLAD